MVLVVVRVVFVPVHNNAPSERYPVTCWDWDSFYIPRVTIVLIPQHGHACWKYTVVGSSCGRLPHPKKHISGVLLLLLLLLLLPTVRAISSDQPEPPPLPPATPSSYWQDDDSRTSTHLHDFITRMSFTTSGIISIILVVWRHYDDDPIDVCGGSPIHVNHININIHETATTSVDTTTTITTTTTDTNKNVSITTTTTTTGSSIETTTIDPGFHE